MAAKLVILVAVMATLAVLTHATGSYPYQMDQCKRQMTTQWPDHCESYLMQSMTRYGSGRNQGSQYMDQCCDELRMMDTQCQCEAVEMMMERMGSSQQMGRHMMDMAMGLPMMCGTMSHKCSMSYMD